MRRLVFTVGLLLALLPGSAARGEPAQDTTLTLQKAIDAALGQHLDSIRAAIASAEASTADLETTRQTVILNTKQAYYSVLANQRLLQVADETVRQNQKHLEEAQARFQVGLAPRFDVTQAQVQLSTAQLNQVTARNNVALARETLRTAMGVTGPFPFTLI